MALKGWESGKVKIVEREGRVYLTVPGPDGKDYAIGQFGAPIRPLLVDGMVVSEGDGTVLFRFLEKSIPL
ncbi:hypothetical protein DRO48_00865 [Candidatus Bathyarchaeota archaeon]|nr:MAG: hypothetical protein DRO48_00865 [Candidatus Bathyarchaeota archaeon]